MRREGDYSHTPVGSSRIRAENVTFRKKTNPQNNNTGAERQGSQSPEITEMLSVVQTIRQDMTLMKDMLGQVTATLMQYHNKLEAITEQLAGRHGLTTNQQHGVISMATVDAASSSPTFASVTSAHSEPAGGPPQGSQRTPLQQANINAKIQQQPAKLVSRLSDAAHGPTARSTLSGVSGPAAADAAAAGPRPVTHSPTTLPRRSEGDVTKPLDPDSEEGRAAANPKPKQNRQRRQIVVGTGKPDDSIQAVERLRYIQAWSFKPDTTAEEVLAFLNKVQPSKNYSVEKRELKTTRHASFVIGIPEGLWTQLTEPSVWPHGVKFSDWFPARPRQQRGDTSSGDSAKQT